MSRYTRQDLVFAPDPFNDGSNPRPWLVIADDAMPFPGDFLGLACTRSSYPDNYEITAREFESDHQPDQATYCLPWLLATLKTEDFAFRKGTLTKRFTDEMAAEASTYVDLG